MNPCYPIYFQTGCEKHEAGKGGTPPPPPPPPDLDNEVPKVLKGDFKVEEQEPDKVLRLQLGLCK